ncbi:MAG: mannose-1-phosphate guanylyltransferase [Pirellulales bacterium]|nr:mannose-1-phosphate guanylyltransferase [Pirellulales bacterium]
MIHAIIMAGGAGTRFWPESRADFPKQLLTLTGNRSMMQTTVDRIKGLVPEDRILVVTGERLVENMVNQLPSLPDDSVIGEPCRRDTAPCIGLAALLCVENDPQATMVVMPADHVINQTEAFCRAIEYAAQLVEEVPGRIATFGISPSYPAETFGYIERGDRLQSAGENAEDSAAFQVKQFREKPKVAVAERYLEAGTFYWNSGIFVWKAATILEELRRREPEMLRHLETIAKSRGSKDFEKIFATEFDAIQGVSIDYAVMEHAQDIVVIEATFDWDDVGNWTAVGRLRGTDGDGNTIVGQHLGIDTKDSIIRGQDGHLVVTLGVKEAIVVQTPDATLVADRNSEESIRELVKMIKEKGWTEYL